MPQKGKIRPEEKVEIVQRYLRGEVSQEGAAALVGVNNMTLRDWLRIYQSEGASGLMVADKNRRYSCTRNAKEPRYLAENLLDRDFQANRPNEKWLTDVTEFKWYEGFTVHKVYLSAILDLYDRRIVSHVISECNNNPLAYKTFDKAVAVNPDAHPLFHSDRGFQYTNRTFHDKLEQAGMGLPFAEAWHRMSKMKLKQK